jgi:N-formylglutamate deformylase
MVTHAFVARDPDADVVRGFEDTTLPPSAFGHREHVLVAWTYLRALPFHEASARFLAALRRYVTAHGAASKLDEELTLRYLRAIEERIRATPASPSFSAFAAAHPDLLRERLPPCPSA